MRFKIDSLPQHPTYPSRQDTFFLNFLYGMYLGIDSLDWGATYMVGDLRSVSGTIYEQAIMIIDTGCVPLDFELFTEAVYYDADGDSFASPWWLPNDTNAIAANKYILRAIATGFNTPRLSIADTINFMGPESYYYVVSSTPREIKDSTVSPTEICCFYSRDLYGYDVIPTIDSTGLNLQGWSWPYEQKSFYLHLSLTTPALVGTDHTHLTGMIILHIRGMAHE